MNEQPAASSPLYIKDIQAVFVIDRDGRVLQLCEGSSVVFHNPSFAPLINPVVALERVLKRFATVRKLRELGNEA